LTSLHSKTIICPANPRKSYQLVRNFKVSGRINSPPGRACLDINFQNKEQLKMAEQGHAFEMPAHGAICWTELATKDTEAAKKFYSELLGWSLKGSEAAGMEYTEFSVNGRPYGGIYKMGEEMGDMPSHWMSYVAVDDVDAAAARVTELGGTIRVPPMDIPNVGRFTVISDPTGAAISLITLGKHS
jgi:predicted enzyme related to lactoylglutathione lyase